MGYVKLNNGDVFPCMSINSGKIIAKGSIEGTSPVQRSLAGAERSAPAWIERNGMLLLARGGLHCTYI